MRTGTIAMGVVAVVVLLTGLMLQVLYAESPTTRPVEEVKPDKTIPMSLQAGRAAPLSHQSDGVEPGVGYRPAGGGQPGGGRQAPAGQAHPGGQQAPQQNGQQGFSVWTVGQGEVIAGVFPAQQSARAATRETLQALGRHFGRRPTVTGAMADDKDRHVEAAFAGHRQGVAVLGMVVCDIADGRTVIGIIDAPSRQFPQVVGQLSGVLQQKLPGGGGGQQVPLRRTQLPDRSGAISLPAGWRIAEANQGTVVAFGPGEQLVELSIFTQVYTPQAAANPMGARPPIVAPWGPPVQVFPVVQQELWNFARSVGGPARQFARVVEAKPIATQGHDQAAMILYDWKLNGKDYRTLGLFLMKPIPPGTWMYYHSSVSSPAERFARDLPTLVRVWESWRVDPRVGLRRLRKAMESLNTCNRIIQDVTANRARVFDKAHRKWTEYIRNTATAIDDETGEVREVDDTNLDEIIANRNDEAGYRRYRRVPVDEMN